MAPAVTVAATVPGAKPKAFAARRATITLSATDGGGAGVERIEYAVDPEQFPGRPQTGVYEGPFLTWNEGTWPGMKLYVRAIDNAGNVRGRLPRDTRVPLTRGARRGSRQPGGPSQGGHAQRT